MNSKQAITIAGLLNSRGFVIDEDVDDIPVSYKKIESWINENKSLLAAANYNGGNIAEWNTGFRTSACAYGVIDSKKISLTTGSINTA